MWRAKRDIREHFIVSGSLAAGRAATNVMRTIVSGGQAATDDKME